MRVGLTGGIGSGKSVVAQIFERLGAYVIDTDVLAREAVAPHTAGLAEIARLWPQAVRNEVLDRGALGAIVFGDPGARERLNAIVHPIIRRLALAREHDARTGQLIVHVVPLLFETGYGAMIDKSIVVIAPDAQRIARVIARDGIDEAQVRARMDAQIAAQDARTRADYVIENDGDLAHLEAQTRATYDALMR